MANPRKFSEKIALHNQKQAEETAAFEKIMREVSDATSKPDETTLAQYGLTSMQSPHMSENNNVKSNETQTRGRSSVGPIRRPGDRKIDTSPYSSGNVAYLSPPSDSSWRRTSSDSAIHQSLTQTQDHHIYGTHSPFTLSPAAQRRITNVSSNIDIKSYANQHANNQHNMSGANNDGRPRSSCGLSRLPGINIYPSSHDNSIQIPIGNNTGSLPDLTSVHFPSPLHTPIDQEHDHSSSPYSSSPITASPTTLSPTSIHTRHPNTSFQYSPSNSPGDSNNTFSPTHHTQHSQQYLSVPDSKYHHVNKGIENAYQQTQSAPHHQQPQTHQSYGNLANQQIHYHNSQHSPPNNALHGSHGNLTNLGNTPQTNLGYRSPKCRPSPGSSPGLVGSLPNSGDSNTSAPCSPASQGNNGQYDNYYLNPSIQATFEQFSLVDSPVQDFIASQSPNAQSYQYDDVNYSHLNSSLDSMQQQQQQQQQQHQQQQQQSNTMQQQNSANLAMSNQKMPNTNSHATASQHQQQQSLTQQQQQQLNNSQAPNTPTSIPEIIFTDFSSASELSKDLFGDPLRPIDLELGTMDFAGYQMLTDPNGTMIADPTIEDSFRRDLN